MVSNCKLSDIVSMPEMLAGEHNLEEGDQLVILNAFDVMFKHPNCTLDIYSVDTDVFILLLGNFPLLPRSTFLQTISDKISIEDCYSRLGKKRSEALIGWYAFKGTDCTGGFAGKGVLSHFKVFMKADDDILDAFATFGLTEKLPTRIILQMERYSCLIYKIGGIN